MNKQEIHPNLNILVNHLILDQSYDHFLLFINNYENTTWTDISNNNQDIQFMYNILLRIANYYNYHRIHNFTSSCTYAIACIHPDSLNRYLEIVNRYFIFDINEIYENYNSFEYYLKHISYYMYDNTDQVKQIINIFIKYGAVINYDNTGLMEELSNYVFLDYIKELNLEIKDPGYD